MKETYKDFIGIYENAFSKDYCDFIIKEFDNNRKEEKHRLIGKDNYFQDSSMNVLKHIKDSKLQKQASDHFYKKLNTILGLYVNKYRQISCELNGNYEIADFKVQRTEPSQGYHIWHSEYDPGPMHNARWGVWTLYLNDIEEGGETEFLYQNYRVKPKTGTVCIFPSYYTHTHRGNPPLKDTKYIITGWLLYEREYLKYLKENLSPEYEQMIEKSN